MNNNKKRNVNEISENVSIDQDYKYWNVTKRKKYKEDEKEEEKKEVSKVIN